MLPRLWDCQAILDMLLRSPLQEALALLGEFRKFSPKDADTFVRVDERLKKLARYLQPFFLEPPPDISKRDNVGCEARARPSIGSRSRSSW